MGKRSVEYDTSPRVLVECVMDNHMFNLIMETYYVIGFVNVNLEMVLKSQ